MKHALVMTFLLAACGREAPPVMTPAAATTASQAPTPPPAAPRAPAMDPSAMPDDAVHAGLGKGGRPAMPAGHPPLAPSALPPGHPPTGAPASPAAPSGMNMGAVAAETGVERPLPLEGAGSVAELRARLALIGDAALHAPIEEAFRKLFTVDRASRDGARAREILEPLASHADAKVSATALRMLGYVALNSGFDAPTATARYQQAIGLDADYGEAHYALAFVLAISDLDKGKAHFDKAMSLGVPDVRNLRQQFYGGAAHP